VPCLIIGGRSYPQFQFQVGDSPDDNCKEPHWHAFTEVFPLDPPAGQTGGLTDPAIQGCGFGRVATVPQGRFSIALEAWQEFLLAHGPP